jgi:hypothetical protein
MIHQEPLRARVLVKTILISLALFVMWTAVAEVDEITKSEGKVIPSSQIQILQSLDGGIVAEINVKEGAGGGYRPDSAARRSDAFRILRARKTVRNTWP